MENGRGAGAGSKSAQSESDVSSDGTDVTKRLRREEKERPGASCIVNWLLAEAKSGTEEEKEERGLEGVQ